MGNKSIDDHQGHWILAKMGKKVLRPGGKELTLKMIHNLQISTTDNVVEFAPGLGYTAAITLKHNPKSYTGIELNDEAASLLRKTINGTQRNIIVGNAANCTLDDCCCNKVYGEAMLTMQADHRKSEIIKEAYRILEKGGLYGIHELGLAPDGLPEAQKADIQKQLAQCIKVNARPLTVKEWTELLEKEGFKVIKTETNAMALLEKSRILKDEGFFRTLKFVYNVMTHPHARKRIMEMKDVFDRNKDYMNAVTIVAQKV